MQFYDILDKMPVQLFLKPDFNADTGLTKIKGCYKVYKIGDNLELNTLYYKYPKNFIVLNVETFEFCIIKDSVVVGVVNELTEDNIAQAEKIYTPTGEELAIDYLEDVYNYKRCYDFYKRKYQEYKEEKNNILLNIQSQIDEDDFAFIRLKPKMDLIDVQLIELKNDFEQNCFIDDKEAKSISEFGMYMACLINKMNEFHVIEEVGNLLQLKKEVPSELLDKYNNIDIVDFEHNFNVLKDKFSQFLFNNRGLNHKYLKWLELDNCDLNADYVKIVEDVILNIYDILEN